MSLKLGTTTIAGVNQFQTNAGWSVFDIKWVDHLLNDISWLRADTFSWQDGTVYTTAYNKLVEEYSTGTEETDGSITFKRSTNGFKIATSDYESAILDKYNDDGIAWYYILDTTNQRFKLPRTKFGFEGLRTNVADDIAESLPSHTHDEYFVFSPGARQISPTYNGTNTGGSIKSITQAITNTSYSSDGVLQTGEPSSSTYQDNAPVQERATQMYLYFYVGEYSQSAIEQTAGLNSEMFNAKVDTSSLVEVPSILTETTAVLKTSYVSGTSGYNIWSNGYCVQWGMYTGNIYNSGKGVSISFAKTFSNTNYTPKVTLVSNYTSYDSAIMNSLPFTYNLGTSSMTICNYQSNTTIMKGYAWEVSGYLAEGQY